MLLERFRCIDFLPELLRLIVDKRIWRLKGCPWPEKTAH